MRPFWKDLLPRRPDEMELISKQIYPICLFYYCF